MADLSLQRRVQIAIGAFVLAVLPVIVYDQVKAEPSGPWPSPVVVIAAPEGRLVEFALLDLVGEDTLIEFPAEAVLTSPDTGSMRAVMAFRIGGSETISEAFRHMLGLPIRYFLESGAPSLRNASREDVADNLGPYRSQAIRSLGEGGDSDLNVREAPGRWNGAGPASLFMIDIPGLLELLEGSEEPLPDPSVAPSPPPSVEPTLPPQPVPSPQQVVRRRISPSPSPTTRPRTRLTTPAPSPSPTKSTSTTTPPPSTSPTPAPPPSTTPSPSPSPDPSPEPSPTG